LERQVPRRLGGGNTGNQQRGQESMSHGRSLRCSGLLTTRNP
jgi:hypothetical protein